jgi:hypothetical protein
MAVSDYLLEIKGPDLKGESQDDQFKESIHIDSWSWTGTNSSMHHVGAGGGAGKVMHGDMQCQKYLDKASIILFDKLNCGDHFREAILHCRKKTCRDVAERDARVVPGRRTTGFRSVDVAGFCQKEERMRLIKPIVLFARWQVDT